jgi:hypothetical protein
VLVATATLADRAWSYAREQAAPQVAPAAATTDTVAALPPPVPVRKKR